MSAITLLHGDCIEEMKKMPDCSVDSICTDPPYGIRFMGKAWDGVDIEQKVAERRAAPSHDPSVGPNGGHKSIAAEAGQYDTSLSGNRAFQEWTRQWATEALRVLKPGGYLLCFASTRTYHRMGCGVEDAGFEVRDQIGWAFGSGFPKSHNGPWGGTALKPAWEPIVFARKPLIGTVEANWREHGTGALNIDASRIPTDDKLGGGAEKAQNAGKIHEGWQRPWMSDPAAADAYAERIRANVARSEALGRWPANLIHDGSEEVLAAFPYASGAVAPVKGTEPTGHGFSGNVYGAPGTQGRQPIDRRDGGGSAARFFYCSKASRSDRNEGCEHMERKPLHWSSGDKNPGSFQSEGTDKTSQNNHPTVKPTDLMRYLCRLVTPAGGVVLDPFMGSGSTGKAAVLEGFRFVGIEREADYMAIARARIAHAEAQVAQAAAEADAASRQADLFGEVAHA